MKCIGLLLMLVVLATGSSMLAQANNLSQNILSLLG